MLAQKLWRSHPWHLCCVSLGRGGTETLTGPEAASRCCPAHGGRDGPHDSPDPRVGDADPLQWCVTAGIQEDVEGTQGPCERIHSPGEQGNSRDSTAGGKGHG